MTTLPSHSPRLLPGAATASGLVLMGLLAQPVAVRYAWAINPSGANLYNRDGLPAAPFRTDEW